jgi:hypothetical protein
MNPTKNPFRPTRFEHHEHPLIWISSNVRRLEGLKSVYVAGTRGSGKTSLLKAVNWRERLHNETVRDQLGEDIPDYVAVYFRLPDYLTSAIGLIDWAAAFPASPSPETIGFELFAQLIEFAGAQLICEAIASLRATHRFDYTIEQEIAAVREIVDGEPIIAAFGGDRCNGLDDLSQVFRKLHQRINVLITRGEVAQALDHVPNTQPGLFINELAARLRSLACSTDGICSSDFHIKICIDDCETLRAPQQRFLNTLVRNSKHPLFWVISFVSVDYDSTNTTYHNQTLSDADRSQIHLDEMGRKEFVRLCENVSLLRLFYSGGGGDSNSPTELPKNYFKLHSVLGRLSINDFLADAAHNSLSADFKALVARSSQTRKGRGGRRNPPIYETYVEEKLGERLRDDSADNWEAYMRRKQVAALLAICSEYRIARPPYVGAGTILSMSDECIRDYLEIMASIFDEAIVRREIKKVEDLARREVPISADTQQEGVRKSSEAKLDGIRNSLENNAAEATRAIEFLGKLTARLQGNHASLVTLATPERGNFLFDINDVTDGALPAGERRAFILKLLRRCEADGLLRPARLTLAGEDPDTTTELAFHLHRRFAAYFGFSYRGPYGLTRLPMADFAEACDAAGESSIDECVTRAYAKIQGEEPFDEPRLL